MNETIYIALLVILNIVFSGILLRALHKAGLGKPALSVISIIFMVWLTTIYILIGQSFFSATGVPRLSFVIAILLPVVLGYAAVQRFKVLQEAIDNMTTVEFLYMQYWRAIFGIMFFFSANLPMWFIYVGGLGDIVAGLAPFLAVYYLQKGNISERQAIIRGNLAGIIDFIVVLSLGLGIVLQNESPDIAFSLIPLYVVPLFILLHIFSLQQLTPKKCHKQ